MRKELVFLLEEPSARIMIEGILPKLFESGEVDITVRYIVFEGKQDLEKQVTRKIAHYNNLQARFIILRDQDSGECKEIKKRLQQKCAETFKSAQCIIRIACRELESWYLADLKTIEEAFPEAKKANLAIKNQNKQKFRNPDKLVNPAKELRSLFPEYQKMSGSRAIAPYLSLDNARSRSFYHFINAVRKAMSDSG